jgi:lipoate-protein ligase A
MHSPLIDAATTCWELLVEPAGRSGAENMALDLTLLAEAGRSGRAFLRLYRFDPPCLSFGRHEPARARYDRAAIARLGVDVVRRPTGGRAVWHEHEVTYAVAAPIDRFASLRGAYREIHARLAAALRRLGADPTLAPDHPRPPATTRDHPTSCFATPVGGEVLVAGRKLVGSAQLQDGKAFLQHGSILLGGSQEIVRVVSRPSAGIGRETTVAAVLGRPVSFDEVAAAVVAAWDGGTMAALDRPRPPATAPFSDPSWTWRR